MKPRVSRMFDLVGGLVSAAFALSIAGTALAHHSAGAVFDTEQTIELTGAVTEVEWMNPHVWFYVEAETAGGESEIWAFEMASPNGLMRRGWRRDSLEVGDVVAVVGWVARDGSPRAAARSVSLPNGDQLFTGQNESR